MSLGAIASFAFAPYYYILLLPLVFSSFLYLIYNAKSLKEYFLLGWSFGSGYFLAGLYWISYALIVDQSFIWLIPFSIVFIPALLGLYIGIVTSLSYFFRKTPLKLAMAFISFWTLVEITRTYLFTGFPWMALGYALSPINIMLQTADIWGVFGLSIIVLTVSLAPFILITTSKKLSFFYSAASILMVSANIVYGHIALKNGTVFTNYSVFVVQPNIPQEIKWDRSHRKHNLEKIMNLSRDSGHATYIVWPEAAVPFLLNGEKIRDHIKTIIPPSSYLITGGIRNSIEPRLEYWNSLFIIDHDGHIKSYYDKIHLVPFGEYIPFTKFLPLEKITYGLIDYSSGNKNNTVLTLNDLPSFRPLICYESFFSQEMLYTKQRPDILINITNDAWYGTSPGPYQHFDITKLRAIEYRIPLVRAANTGISAMISPTGEILQQVELQKEGTILKNVPAKNKLETFYQLYGNYGGIIFSIFVLLMTLLM